MTRILVTGGTGTLGRLVVPRLRDAGGKVRVLSRSSRPDAAGTEVVTGDLVSNAVALNSASFNSGRIVRPGVAGLVIAAWGTGMALLANAVSFLFVVAALLWLRGEELRPSPSARGRGRVREGFAYVRRRRDLQSVKFHRPGNRNCVRMPVLVNERRM